MDVQGIHGMPESELKIKRRRLPHWTLEGSTYFVTFRLRSKNLSALERKVVLDHIRSGHGKFYDLAATVVMPDHVHLILKPWNGFDLSRILKGIKGVSARLLNAMRGTSGTLWQKESMDRILRDDKEFEVKLQYMIDNPLKSQIIKNDEDYDGWFFNPDFA
jgi:REP element-mobilizing transposase RayT